MKVANSFVYNVLVGPHVSHGDARHAVAKYLLQQVTDPQPTLTPITSRNQSRSDRFLKTDLICSNFSMLLIGCTTFQHFSYKRKPNKLTSVGYRGQLAAANPMFIEDYIRLIQFITHFQ
ncbi:hypothetical protein P9314_09475 [Paenibacillus validus]|uniref:Uncharacterized protein n=1 Tax=Paenibacillus validus TaxID=44253 RepID=A0A7X2ZF36_9BACL|nr:MULTISPECIES: hypothetical protein [Paenibacillus]MED4600929.1 hypothetical protein [Paenibacillus validus]MED4607223.1 hypothetical protein [Paenibacillus validus]MUG73668.1 hypothetical protein [Paenibacillus validus]